MHGILPGWNLPRLSTDALSKGVGLKADYLGKIFHAFRFRIEYDKFVEERAYRIHSKDLRDVRAILKLASGFLKLLFPDLSTATESEFVRYCLEPAVALRQRLRDQLHYLDPEFPNYEILINPEAAPNEVHTAISLEEPAEDSEVLDTSA
ncbi:BREX system Lon protease-like protein BrxL [Spirosoma spitsbergense]|uniref:BREX system Lon protease-like protein BrxL n=1 Tax=Spirosoma spitsbergense TaxID=431554 RepID=UPI0024816AB5|nr:BREX system Lon protease-like protein BrxL [Spirosoma spitsbergense]